ncbi:hypothetical protein TrVE_jg4287 [Triparma verrucosa]|uniref:EamA domain-containing protein n=1 Tax=Triparma verrucosa TaxID=1606542 RepID=A0A9W7FJ59_9STRA|nr:hypothetical protein TrVE_jg4287 [Triparma verrucosa]
MEIQPASLSVTRLRAIGSFILLVLFSSASTLIYTYSIDETTGYVYNTASSQVSVEVIKFTISLLGEYNDHSSSSSSRQKFLPHLASSISSSLTPNVFLLILFLSFSYLVSNYLLFEIMRITPAGTFSLFKSFTPCVVSLLSFFLLRSPLPPSRLLTILIMLLALTLTTTPETSSPQSLLLLTFQLTLSSLNMVLNGHLLSPSTTPLTIPKINLLMYSLGSLLNYVLYLLRPSPLPFFHSYSSPSLLIYLLTKSFTGLISNYVFKYNGPIVKSLSSPVVSAVCIGVERLGGGGGGRIELQAGGIVILTACLYIIL